MKNLITLWLCILFPLLAQAGELSFPNTGSTPKGFMPKDWFILKQAEGDLNKDGLKDYALIIAPNSEKKEELSESERTLVLLFAQADKKLTLSASKGGFILGKWDGGMLGDPLWEFFIDKGIVVVKIYGGSRNRWGMTYRFRWQDNDWYLIGYATLEADNLELTSTTIDANLNTGVIEITDMAQDKESKRSMKEKLKPMTLKAFTPVLADKIFQN